MKIKSISDTSILFDDNTLVQFFPHNPDTQIYIDIDDIVGMTDYDFRRVNIKIDRSKPNRFILTDNKRKFGISVAVDRKDFINVNVNDYFYCGQYVEVEE